MSDRGWEAIFNAYDIHSHDFAISPFFVTAQQIKQATAILPNASNKDYEPRILCYQDNRDRRPRIFKEHGLFILPITNGKYAILQGEGYVDIPPITQKEGVYRSQLDFVLDTAKVGDSEMQHLDYAYASSLIRTVMGDTSLVLTIRGRKYTPSFSFQVAGHTLNIQSVQTEVDAGYEGKQQLVLVEAKNTRSDNTIIKQLYYPYRQWSLVTQKPVSMLFFQKRQSEYSFWQFAFADPENYDSIQLVKTAKFVIHES
jgi:hypothetical protein